MEFTRDKMQARLNELNKLADAKFAELTPLQDKLAEIVRTDGAGQAALREKIRAAREGLGEIQTERGLLARAMGGYSLTVASPL